MEFIYSLLQQILVPHVVPARLSLGAQVHHVVIVVAACVFVVVVVVFLIACACVCVFVFRILGVGSGGFVVCIFA